MLNVEQVEREGYPEDGSGDTLVEQGQASGEETTEGSPDNLETIEQERSIRLWVLELIPSGLLDLRHVSFLLRCDKCEAFFGGEGVINGSVPFSFPSFPVLRFYWHYPF